MHFTACSPPHNCTKMIFCSASIEYADGFVLQILHAITTRARERRFFYTDGAVVVVMDFFCFDFDSSQSRKCQDFDSDSRPVGWLYPFYFIADRKRLYLAFYSKKAYP